MSDDLRDRFAEMMRQKVDPLLAEIDRLRACCDEEARDHAHLLVQVQAVADAWRDPLVPRASIQGSCPQLASELDELSERVR